MDSPNCLLCAQRVLEEWDSEIGSALPKLDCHPFRNAFFKPGRQPLPRLPKYSNAGIAVVGYTLEELNHQPFPEYLKQAVLAPFGMNASAFASEPDLLRNLAKAHLWSYDGLKFPAPTFE